MHSSSVPPDPCQATGSVVAARVASPSLRPHDARGAIVAEREAAWRGSVPIDGDPMARLVGYMRTGVILVGVDGDVAYLNESAKEALAADVGLVLRGDRVVATSPDARRKLGTALTHACRPPFIDGAVLLGPGRGEHVPRPLRVLALERMTGFKRQVDQSLALLCLGSVRRRVPDAALLGQLFGLTPAEAALMSGIASGSRLHQCAEQRGVSLATVRAQLRNVFVKTGAGTQADLTLIAWSIPGLWIN
jgi:DNA-binding CsgD family transcriptional regulator